MAAVAARLPRNARSRTTWRACLPPLACSLLFVALGTIYNVAVPIFEVQDETQHYAVARFVGLHGRLPVAGDPETASLSILQEAAQPPLYYLLAAPLTLLDPTPLERLFVWNPFVALGDASQPDNRNFVLHTDRERFPYSGTALAVHLVRGLSTLLGAATVAATYALARLVFPARRSLALLAAAFNLGIPQFAFVAGAVTNDNLVTAVSAWTLVVAVRVVQAGNATHRTLVLGALAGAGILAKPSGLGLVPLGLLALGWRTLRDRSPRNLLTHGALFLGLVAVETGWWLARNWQLYGDPIGLRPLVTTIGPGDERRSLADVIAEAEGFWWSFWAVFGHFNLVADGRLYRLYDALLLAAAIGLIIWGFARRRAEPYDAAALVLSVVWLALVVVGLLRWTTIVRGSQARLLFPAVPAICLLLALGLSSLLPQRVGRWPAFALVALLIGIASLLPFTLIAPAYALPPGAGVIAELPPSVRRVDVWFGEEVKLVGYELDRTVARPGEPIEVTLYWEALRRPTDDYAVALHLLDGLGRTAGSRHSYPVGGLLPTSQWPAGAVVRDPHPLRLDAPLAGPASLRVAVDLGPAVGRFRSLGARDESGATLSRPVAVARLHLPGPSWSGPLTALDASFGDEIRLSGYWLESAELAPGATIRGWLRWQALRAPGLDYTVFVHLIGPDGHLVAQHDAEPVAGTFPTSLWRVGERVDHPFELRLPSRIAPGEHRLVAGLYDRRTLTRLPSGQGDTVLLAILRAPPR